MGQGELRFAPLGPPRMGRGPEAHTGSCNQGSVLSTVALDRLVSSLPLSMQWSAGSGSSVSAMPPHLIV